MPFERDRSKPIVFFGDYDHVLDAQGRVSLPSEWRKRDDETEMVLFPAQGGKTLQLFPIETFTEFLEKARKQSIANPKMQKAFAMVGARARMCRCDKHGRMALDRKMLDGIGVKGQLKLIGALTHIQLIAPENWIAMSEQENLNESLDLIQEVSNGSSLASSGGDA